MQVNIGQRRPLLGPGFRQNSQFLYSANSLPSALAKGDYDFFTVNVGGTGQGGGTNVFSFTETNLLTARRVPDQEKWKITELGFYFSSNLIIADVQKILESGYLWVDMPDYRAILGPPFMWPAGAGVSGVYATTANATTTQTWSNGWPTPTARMKLKTPIYLDPATTFALHYTVTVTQTLTGATDSLTQSSKGQVWLILAGEVQRSIVQG